jgi:hypothetical protein
MPERYCEVNIYAGYGTHLGTVPPINHTDDEEEHHRVGCNNPARFENPFYGMTAANWCERPFNYARWLCAEHYDEALWRAKEWELHA